MDGVRVERFRETWAPAVAAYEPANQRAAVHRLDHAAAAASRKGT
jgi:hypothetical protein